MAVHTACTEDPIGHWGARHARGGRTRNMPRIFVTLDVSKLSGWLNADAPCRVTRRHVEGGTLGDRGGRAWRVVAVHAACTEGPSGDWGNMARAGGAP